MINLPINSQVKNAIPQLCWDLPYPFKKNGEILEYLAINHDVVSRRAGRFTKFWGLVESSRLQYDVRTGLASEWKHESGFSAFEPPALDKTYVSNTKYSCDDIIPILELLSPNHTVEWKKQFLIKTYGSKFSAYDIVNTPSNQGVIITCSLGRGRHVNFESLIQTALS